MKKLVRLFVFLLFVLPFLSAQGQINKEASQMLWKGIGGKEKWEKTNYILFVANGGELDYTQSARTFLVNRKSGQVRFEGKSLNGDNLAVFFNFNSGKVTKFYINGTQLKELNDTTIKKCDKIKNQFQQDISFLFLSALVNTPETKTGTLSSKIINAEKLQSINIELKNGALSGEVLFNAETGYIKQLITKDKGTYYVNGYKDIGDGLFLPTSFKNINNSTKSVYFSTVAAFSDMEESKFIQL
ncbi:hypothetical protein ORI89_15130 [Sphingobacterium sp. UT-1RO-CII-1]|uniref:hypothetical protein n=1 Tax=Sphingobacterium sp. UT-1RO-CII-1 TaxID=2995225 RepID=UPI00227A239C|nr:hypothetical protein [Sphingobacterium sp. UT-1RO-CII-1]MCY4780991.1 hypothetical protein [Sphingobacterium sp. UT-1RO-CII-1]